MASSRLLSNQPICFPSRAVGNTVGLLSLFLAFVTAEKMLIGYMRLRPDENTSDWSSFFLFFFNHKLKFLAN